VQVAVPVEQVSGTVGLFVPRHLYRHFMGTLDVRGGGTGSSPTRLVESGAGCVRRITRLDRGAPWTSMPLR
jgi:hypothetical protein